VAEDLRQDVPERLGKLSFAVYFVGFNLLYFPMFLAWETPRRVFHYPGDRALPPLGDRRSLRHQDGSSARLHHACEEFRLRARRAGQPVGVLANRRVGDDLTPPLENWPNRPSYANGRLEFVDDATAADGGGGRPRAHRKAAESLEADHEDHASIWPFGIGVGMFVMFLGLSGLTPYVADFATARGAELAGSTAGSENVLTPMLSLVGVGILGSRCSSTDARNSTHRDSHRRTVAVRGVGTTKTGVWFFLASDVVVFGAVIGRTCSCGSTAAGEFRSRAALGDDRTDQHLRPAHLEFHGRSRAGDGRTREQARNAVVDGGPRCYSTHVPRHQGYEWSQEFAPHLLVHRPRVLAS